MSVTGKVVREGDSWMLHTAAAKHALTGKQRKELAARADCAPDELDGAEASFSQAYNGDLLKVERVRLPPPTEPATAAPAAGPQARRPPAAPTGPRLNPYGFLPFVAAPPPERVTAARSRTRSEPDLLSGWFDVELLPATPLSVFGGASSVPVTHKAESAGSGGQFRYVPHDDPSAEHRVVRLATGPDGLPTLPGSTLKGAARTWFEALTSSLRQMQDSPVAWRSSAPDDPALGRRLARLHLSGPTTTLQAGSRDGHPRTLPEGLSASLEPLERVPLDVTPGLKGPALLAARLQAVLKDYRLPDGAAPRLVQDGLELRSAQGGPGAFVLKVGVGLQSAVSVHLVNQEGSSPRISVPTPVLECWYAAHAASPAATGATTATKVSGVKAIAPNPALLKHGALVWYQMKGAEVVYLGALRNGRWADTSPVSGRVPEQHRADQAGLLTPAEQVFGCAGSGTRTSGAEREQGAVAGRVRVGTATWTGEPPERREYCLAPLSSPKLSAAGLYLEPSGGANQVAWTDDNISTVAGSKVYVHTVPAQDQPSDSLLRLAKDANGVAARTSQNSTVEALLPGGGHFVSRVHFEDLSKHELGALLLAFAPSFGKAADRGWKLGLGRPLGLGSVRNRIARTMLLSAEALSEPFSATPAVEVDEARVQQLRTDALTFYGLTRGESQHFDAFARHGAARDRRVEYLAFEDLTVGVDGQHRHQRSEGRMLPARTEPPPPTQGHRPRDNKPFRQR